MIWDRGTWEPIGDPGRGPCKRRSQIQAQRRAPQRRLRARPHEAAQGDRGRQNWLLIKKRDEYAGEGKEPTEEFDTSVKSGRTMDQILHGESAVWTSNRAQKKTSVRSKRAATAKPAQKPAAR
jgi:bifunctional non-homologous end joining protein LigD